jgi:hypothetical protein
MFHSWIRAKQIEILQRMWDGTAEAPGELKAGHPNAAVDQTVSTVPEPPLPNEPPVRQTRGWQRLVADWSRR